MANYQNVTIEVSIPEETPDESDIYIVGAGDHFGNWQHIVKMERKENNVFFKEFQLKKGTELEYKYSLGDWQRVEKDKNFLEVQNRTFTITDDVIISDTIENWAGFSILESTLTGNIKIIEDFYSPQLDNKRTIIIYFPPDYEENIKERYPVLYMHDGNNIFDAKTSFAQVEWQVDENAEELINSGKTKNFIVVGIYNNSERMSEYTPFKDENYEQGGKGNIYLSFIIETVKPYIDSNFRTLPQRENTGIAGSSLGGLISLYAITKYNDIFSFAGVISPSIWWGNRKILDIVKDTKFDNKVNIWVDMGTKEGRSFDEKLQLSDSIINCRDLSEILKQKENVTFKYKEYEGADHSERAWSERINEILLYFFQI